MSDDAVLSALSRLESGMTDVGSRLTSLEVGLSSVASRLTGVDSRLTSVDSRLTSVDSRLTSVDSRLTSVESGLTSVQQSQTSLRVDVMARMDRLENKLTEMRDDITVNIGGTWQNREAINSTRGDLHGLGEQVNIMWRQIKRLEQQVRDINGEP